MADEMSFWKRLKGESPRFFVKIQNYAIWLGGVSTGIIAALAAIPNFTTPDWVTKGYSYILVISIVAGVISKTPIKDISDKSDVPSFEKPSAPNDKTINQNI